MTQCHTDITKRLRRWVHSVDAVSASDLMDEAADEIERLRLTDEEREVLESLVSVGRLYSPKRNAEVIQRLLDRLK